jgi:hypothetical protein
VEAGIIVIHIYIPTSVVHSPSPMLARAASPRHVPPLGTRSMIDAPAAVATDPTRGSSPSHTWRERWREGAVLAGVAGAMYDRSLYVGMYAWVHGSCRYEVGRYIGGRQVCMR